MSPDWTRRPARSECDAYYFRYIEQVPHGNVLDILEEQIAETVALLGGVPRARGTYRYAPEKWSINQVIGHLSDVERVFSHRALWFARQDAQPLPGMEQDDYVAHANFDARPLGSIVDELRHVRGATLDLLRSLEEETLDRSGMASGLDFTVRSTAFILAGHERHHLRVLRERYL